MCVSVCICVSVCMFLCMSLCMSVGVAGLGSFNFLLLILFAVSFFCCCLYISVRHFQIFLYEKHHINKD